MNKVTLKISIHKDGKLFFYHCHSFSNFYINDDDCKKLLFAYLQKLDSLINPKHSFLSVLEVLSSTAFVDDSASLSFKNFNNNFFYLLMEVE